MIETQDILEYFGELAGKYQYYNDQPRDEAEARAELETRLKFNLSRYEMDKILSDNK